VGLAASVIIMLGVYILDSIWDRNEITAFGVGQGFPIASNLEPPQDFDGN
jgi:hypothetical protein